MCKVNKMSEVQVELFLEKKGLDWDESAQFVRECSECDMYVAVDDQSSEREINGEYYYDICDQCSSNIENKEVEMIA